MEEYKIIKGVLTFKDIGRALSNTYLAYSYVREEYLTFLNKCADEGFSIYPGSLVTDKVFEKVIFPNPKWTKFCLDCGWIEENKPNFEPFDLRVENEETLKALYILVGWLDADDFNKIIKGIWDKEYEYLKEYLNRNFGKGCPEIEYNDLVKLYQQIKNQMIKHELAEH